MGNKFPLFPHHHPQSFIHLLWAWYALDSSLYLTYIDLKSEAKGIFPIQWNQWEHCHQHPQGQGCTSSIDKALDRLLLYVRSGTAQVSLQLMENLHLTAIYGSEGGKEGRVSDLDHSSQHFTCCHLYLISSLVWIQLVNKPLHRSNKVWPLSPHGGMCGAQSRKNVVGRHVTFLKSSWSKLQVITQGNGTLH